MKMKYLGIVFFIILLTSPNANATLLWQWDESGRLGSLGWDSARFCLGYANPFTSVGVDPTVSPLVGCNISTPEGLPPQRYSFTEINSPNFVELTTLMTNGVDDSFFRIMIGENDGKIGATSSARNIESRVLTSQCPICTVTSPSAVNDFSGYHIDEIVLTVNSLDGTPFTGHRDFTWQIFGTPTQPPIPEPSTALLFGTGIVGLWIWRTKGRGRLAGRVGE